MPFFKQQCQLLRLHSVSGRWIKHENGELWNNGREKLKNSD